MKLSVGPNQTTVINLLKSGLIADKQYAVTIDLEGDHSSFRFATNKGLKEAFGYEGSFDRDITEISFTGQGDDVAPALSQIIYSSGEVVNDTFDVLIVDELKDNVYMQPGGNFYQYFESTGPWTTARTRALASELYGATGYLSNTTTEDENNFISSKVNAKNIWLGGSDEGHEGIWKWMDGPDDEKGEIFWEFDTDELKYPLKEIADRISSDQNSQFSNWDSRYAGKQSGIEPNNGGIKGGSWTKGDNKNSGGDNENFLVTNFEGTFGFWNDSKDDNTKKIKGYLVEYEADQMNESVGLFTYNLSEPVSGQDPLINECFLEVRGSKMIDLGPGDDRMETNLYISTNTIDGNTGFDELILTDKMSCDPELPGFKLDQLPSNSIELLNFEHIEIQSGNWMLDGDFKLSDIVMKGGALTLPLTTKKNHALRTSKNNFKIHDDVDSKASLEIDFSGVDSSQLSDGGKWRVLKGISKNHFSRLDELIMTTGLPADQSEPDYLHRGQSIIAAFD